jgi:hypothetical protein
LSPYERPLKGIVIIVVSSAWEQIMIPVIITSNNRSNWATQCRVKLLGMDDDSTLPDETLEALIGQAERVVKKKVVNWSSVMTAGGDEKEALIDGSISMLCALLVQPLRNLIGKSEKLADVSVTRDLDFDSLSASLYGEVEDAFSDIAGYVVSGMPVASVINRIPSVWDDLS